MSAEAWAAIGSIFTGAFAVVKYWSKKRLEIEEKKIHNQERVVGLLEKTVDVYKREVSTMTDKMAKIVKDMDNLFGLIRTSESERRNLISAIKNFVKNSESRIRGVEGEIIKINEDLLLIKGKSKNGKAN